MTNTPSVPTIKPIAIADIDRDQQTQPREFVNGVTVIEYAEDMEKGDEFPPVVVFFDGEKHYLADGFHRVEAAVKCNLTEIEAEVHEGSLRDAIVYSCSANATHGLRRTRQDARRAITRLLKDEEWGKWNDSEIARWCSVMPATVKSVRTELEATLQIVKSDKRKVMRDGKEIEVDTSKITGRPRLPWHSHYYAAQKKQGDKPVFMMIGENDSVWVALDTSAVNVAKLMGAATRPIVVNDKWTVGIKLWMGNERRIEQLRGLVGDIEHYQEPSPDLKKLADQMIPTIDFPVTPRTTQFPGMPIPGMPAQPAAVPQPAMPLIVETAEIVAPNGNGNGAHQDEDSADAITERTVVKFPDPTELRDKVLNIAGDVPDSMALIDYLMECVEQMEMTITHFEKQVLSEEDQINLECIKASWHGVGMLGLRMEKLSALPGKIAAVRAALEAAETAKDCEHVIGTCVQLKVGHEAKDRPVMELMNQAQARLMAIKAAA